MGTEVSRVHCKTEEPTLSNEQRGHPPPYPINTPATGSLGLFVLQCVRGCTVLAHLWLHNLSLAGVTPPARSLGPRAVPPTHRAAPGPGAFAVAVPSAWSAVPSPFPETGSPSPVQFLLKCRCHRKAVSCHQSEVSPHLILWVSLTTTQTVLFYFISFFFFILTLAPPTPFGDHQPVLCLYGSGSVLFYSSTLFP